MRLQSSAINSSAINNTDTNLGSARAVKDLAKSFCLALLGENDADSRHVVGQVSAATAAATTIRPVAKNDHHRGHRRARSGCALIAHVEARVNESRGRAVSAQDDSEGLPRAVKRAMHGATPRGQCASRQFRGRCSFRLVCSGLFAGESTAGRHAHRRTAHVSAPLATRVASLVYFPGCRSIRPSFLPPVTIFCSKHAKDRMYLILRCDAINTR